ncbi:MAG TPA: hypothetical protein PLU37_10730 [Chitinophagaceae bacterium]|nr:hypothetical protein [Chitinophagaceae bacterium]
MKSIIALCIGLLSGILSIAQSRTSFTIELVPVLVEGFDGLQSYAWASSNEFVLLVGGRKDGLHQRHPFSAFARQGNNTELTVIDIKNKKAYTRSVLSLQSSIAEQLQSTNMQFYQQGNELILIGGYGYAESKKTHITHPAIIVIKVKEIINAILNDKSISEYILQLEDERMAVTGGRLNKLNNVFYLAGGQRFNGRYNPHGPDHGPGFSQQYTNQIRKFTLSTTSGKISINNYNAITDSVLLHRRDYNLLPQFNKDGNEILAIFSGVFQYEKDVPYTTIIDISQNDVRKVEGFNQQFNHYHTAALSLYDRSNKANYAVFFGGIAQSYKDTAGNIVKDENVPFTKSISVVQRTGQEIKEFLYPKEMPGYLGAAAEFIPANKKYYAENGILQLDKISKEPVVAGYIIGGIESKNANVFWSNDANSSKASGIIWMINISNSK